MPLHPTLRRNRLATALALLAFACAPAASAQDHHDHGHDDHDDEAVELDGVVVESTRSGRRVSEEPIRVDIVNREEIEEKLLMTPGNVSMLVAETAGVRVQSTSPALGASNIRIQGLRGRYTQLLADGLPLYGGQSSSIGLLQIPPTDLGQVEIIKGSASALYGPAALGGVVNLITRRPGAQRQSELLLNATSRGGYDATAYTAAPLRGDWSYSLTGGYHEQARRDLDQDGWIDMPGYERWTLRPRLFWNADNGAKALLTFGATKEDRQGGTTRGRLMPDGQPFALFQDTTRYDAGAVVDIPVRETDRLHLRASAMSADHTHRFGTVVVDDRHQTGFAEASYASAFGDTTWLAGAAIQTDRYRSRTFRQFDYRYNVPGVFLQAEHPLRDDLVLAGSARWDKHNEYGSHLSPRLSLLYRPGRWTLRTSLGRGFYAPTPFVEEIEAAGLSRLEPLRGPDPEIARLCPRSVWVAFDRPNASTPYGAVFQRQGASVACANTDRGQSQSRPPLRSTSATPTAHGRPTCRCSPRTSTTRSDWHPRSTRPMAASASAWSTLTAPPAPAVQSCCCAIAGATSS